MSFRTIEAHGFIWPDDETKTERRPDQFHKHYIQRAPDMEVALKYAKKRNIVVQAGAHVGVWPRWLSSRFKLVYTFEPNLQNFSCLTRNPVKENVFAARGMLGDVHGPLKLEEHSKWIGAHHGIPGKSGEVPVYLIDDLNLPACDALILDVEGMELQALRGAEQTIKKFHPVVMVEDNGLGAVYGFGGYDAVLKYLNEIDGYEEKQRVAKDVVLAP